MTRFDLSQYATVAERLAQFHSEYPDGRIVSTLIGSNDVGNGKTQWVIRADVYLTAGDQANNLPKGTGFASEIDGTGGANNVAALPNAETSAIGRALMVIGYAMNKNNTLASREEMEKVNKAQPVSPWLAQADSISDIEELRRIYANAKAAGAPESILQVIQQRAAALDSPSENKGTGRSRNRSKSDG
jgi:hypothetical protein